MGVETKLIIGNLASEMFSSDEGVRWLSVVATIDLCCLGSQSLIHDFGSKSDTYKRAYFYSDDGNTKMLEDRYGTKLFAIPMNDFLKVFKQECKRQKQTDGELYRHLAWALPLLTRMKNYYPLENLSVILFYH